MKPTTKLAVVLASATLFALISPDAQGPLSGSALAKVNMEQPERTQDGDPEAWDNPRWIDPQFGVPQPGTTPTPVKKQPVYKQWLDRVFALFKGLFIK